jgi:hypothetical protein
MGRSRIDRRGVVAPAYDGGVRNPGVKAASAHSLALFDAGRPNHLGGRTGLRWSSLSLEP